MSYRLAQFTTRELEVFVEGIEAVSPGLSPLAQAADRLLEEIRDEVIIRGDFGLIDMDRAREGERR